MKTTGTTVKKVAKKAARKASGKVGKIDFSKVSDKTLELLKNRKVQLAVGTVAASVVAKLIYDHQHKSTPLSMITDAKIYRAVEKFVKSKF